MNRDIQESDIDEILQNLPSTFWQEFSGKRILITGGSGFLGKYFTSVFVRLNEVFEKNGLSPVDVISLDNFVTSNSNDIGRRTSNFTTLEHDIIKPFTARKNLDFIIHAAGIASPYYYRKFPLETLEVATTGTKNILNLARNYGHSRSLFFSSSEIYGDPSPDQVPTREEYKGNVACLGPRACYDEGKRLGETLVQIYHEQYGVHCSIVRPFNVFGPSMKKTDYRVLPNFATKILNNEPVQIYGNGSQTRTFCYITDAITGFLKVLINGRSAEPYNIGNPNPEISMIDFSLRIGKILDREVDHEIIPYPESYPADEPNRRCPDITKASREIGYAPNVNLDEGLKRFFTWAETSYKNEET